MSWCVPVELAEELASGTGSVMIMRARMRGAVLQPLATISVRAARFVAELNYVTPVGSEGETGLVVMLRVPVGGINRSPVRPVVAQARAGGT